MLGFLRRKMKIFLWILVVGVAVPFLFWGVGSRLSEKDDRPRTAGELFGEDVSLAEFDDAYRAIAINAYLNRRSLDRNQINRLAWDRLMKLKAARRAGISVSDRELAKTIGRRFSREGVFDQALYANVLRLVGTTPAIYEKWVRQSLMIDRLNKLVLQLGWLPDDEVERQLHDEKTQYSIRYAPSSIKDAEREAKVTEDELKSYYDEHKDEYKSAAKVNAEYVLVPWEAKKEKIEITDDNIREYYEENLNRFKHGERVKARHILFKIEGKDRKKAEEKAREGGEKVLERLRKGADFAKLARKYSEDKKTREKGGDLGFIERKDLSKPLSDKAFSLKEGDISDLVKTSEGYHIIKVEGVQEPGTKPLAEVREEITPKVKQDKKQLAEKESMQKAYTKAVDLSLTLVDNPNIAAAAEKNSLEIKETGPFAMNDKLKEIGYNKDFARAAFGTEVGSFSDIVEVREKGYCIIMPKEKIEETTKPFNEARGDIAKKLKEEKGKKKAREISEKQHAEVAKQMEEDGADFASACEALSIKTVESKPFAPRRPIPEIGHNPQIAKTLPGLKPGELSPVFDTDKGSLFFAVTKKEEPQKKELLSEIPSSRMSAILKEENKVSSEWNRWLNEKARMIDYVSSLNQ